MVKAAACHATKLQPPTSDRAQARSHCGRLIRCSGTFPSPPHPSRRRPDCGPTDQQCAGEELSSAWPRRSGRPQCRRPDPAVNQPCSESVETPQHATAFKVECQPPVPCRPCIMISRPLRNPPHCSGRCGSIFSFTCTQPPHFWGDQAVMPAHHGRLPTCSCIRAHPLLP